MERLQKSVETALRGGSDVTGVVSVIGATPVNQRPMQDGSRSRSSRASAQANVGQIIERLNQLAERGPACWSYIPARMAQIACRLSRRSMQYQLALTNTADVCSRAGRLAEAPQSSPVRATSCQAQDVTASSSVQVDREKASRLGVSMQAVNDTLNSAFGQRQVSTIYAQSNQYRVILEAMPQYQGDPSSLGRIYVPAPLACRRAASSVARFERSNAPLVISHQEQFPGGDFELQSRRRRGIERAVTAINAAEAEIGMPTSVSGFCSGDAAEFEVAAGPAVAGARRGDHDLHHVGVLYELHPSG